MQKTLKVGSRITLQDQLQLMMQIELLNVVFMMNTISIKGHLERKRKLTAVCSHQTRIGNLDAHLI